MQRRRQGQCNPSRARLPHRSRQGSRLLPGPVPVTPGGAKGIQHGGNGMNSQAVTDTAPARRADAGMVRLGPRDVAGLVLCGDMYGAPYDLLAAFLGVRPDRARGIVARWRSAG